MKEKRGGTGKKDFLHLVICGVLPYFTVQWKNGREVFKEHWECFSIDRTVHCSRDTQLATHQNKGLTRQPRPVSLLFVKGCCCSSVGPPLLKLNNFPTYEDRLKELKLQSVEKKKDKKWFGPDSQDHIQPNWPWNFSTVQVLQKARTKKVIT